MGRKRYVQVGLGGRSAMYTQAVIATFAETSEMLGVCDVNEGRVEYARKCAREWGYDVKGYHAAQFDQMIAECRPDAVIVTTKDCFHDEYICRAMELGCDVITEKPMTTDEVKCQRIIDTQKRTGKKCTVTFNYRYSPPRTQVKALLMSGVIGDVISVDFHRMLDIRHGADYFRRWHRNKVNSGGLMVHKATHHFDLINWMLSTVPESVFAQGQRRFYTPETAQRYGLTRRTERGTLMPNEEPQRADAPYISVIIPCYNEAKNLEAGVLDEVNDYLIQQDYAWEVVIVNDEATDNSRALIEQFIADKPRFSLVDIPHGGKPAAVWAGIQRARGEVVLFTDMDQSTPIFELGNLLPWAEQGYEVVIGSRGFTREGFSIIRKLGSVVFRTVRQLFLLRDIGDTQCGFKLCTREAALRAFPHLQFFQQAERPSGWKVTAYDVELLYLWEKCGYRIKEVTVTWRNRDRSDTKSQQSDMARYIHESLDMAKQVARIKTNQSKGFYDALDLQQSK